MNYVSTIKTLAWFAVSNAGLENGRVEVISAVQRGAKKKSSYERVTTTVHRFHSARNLANNFVAILEESLQSIHSLWKPNEWFMKFLDAVLSYIQIQEFLFWIENSFTQTKRLYDGTCVLELGTSKIFTDTCSSSIRRKNFESMLGTKEV